MRPGAATWAEVKMGTYILDLNGHAWKVIARKEGFWGIKDRDGIKKIIPAPAPGHAVQILYLTQDELETMLIKTLGAETHSWKLAGSNIYTTIPFDSRPISDMRSHLWLMHGVPSISANDPGKSAGMTNKKALIECHVASHLKPHKDHWMPHVHITRESED